MGGRKWTDEELVLLEELTEKYPLETVARRLNRTKEAVFLKRQRIGMGGYMANKVIRSFICLKLKFVAQTYIKYSKNNPWK